MSKPEDKDWIQKLADENPEAVLKIAREHMKRVLKTDMELDDANNFFKVSWSPYGVAVWASIDSIMDALERALKRECDGVYVIALFDDRPRDRN